MRDLPPARRNKKDVASRQNASDHVPLVKTLAGSLLLSKKSPATIRRVTKQVKLRSTQGLTSLPQVCLPEAELVISRFSGFFTDIVQMAKASAVRKIAPCDVIAIRELPACPLAIFSRQKGGANVWIIEVVVRSAAVHGAGLRSTGAFLRIIAGEVRRNIPRRHQNCVRRWAVGLVCRLAGGLVRRLAGGLVRNVVGTSLPTAWHIAAA